MHIQHLFTFQTFLFDDMVLVFTGNVDALGQIKGEKGEI